ncbi:MAG: hypothetical protein RLZZ475_1921, partial [Pseudomonadota bacterium]
MIAGLPSLSGLLRRNRGRPVPGEPEAGDDKTLKSGENLLRRKRLKVAVFAILFGIVSAAIELPLPLEDGFRAARAQLRTRPVPQDIAMIAIDDATLNEIGKSMPTRLDDSVLVERLIGAGVEKIVYDRAHADPETPASDAQFAATLAKHPGKVWLGMSPEVEMGFQKIDKIVPMPAFREKVGLASMAGYPGPFGLSVIFPTEVVLDGRTEPSISAVLSGYKGPEARYRPDYAFNPKTVPTYSYGDILHGRVDANELRGKSVIIGMTQLASPDFFLLPFYGKIPGSYFHILGAHTLKRG